MYSSPLSFGQITIGLPDLAYFQLFGTKGFKFK